MTQEQQLPHPEMLHPADHRNAARIAVRLTRRDITTGDIARLRRMNPDAPTEAAFWRVCKETGIDQSGPELTRTWANIARMIATGTKVREKETTGPHNGNIQLGTALAQAGYSEERLRTLLNAGPAEAPYLAERAARFLQAREEGQFNWNDAARLVLTGHRTQDQRDYDRTKIARDYYQGKYLTENRKDAHPEEK